MLIYVGDVASLQLAASLISGPLCCGERRKQATGYYVGGEGAALLMLVLFGCRSVAVRETQNEILQQKVFVSYWFPDTIKTHYSKFKRNIQHVDLVNGAEKQSLDCKPHSAHLQHNDDFIIIIYLVRLPLLK